MFNLIAVLFFLPLSSASIFKDDFYKIDSSDQTRIISQLTPSDYRRRNVVLQPYIRLLKIIDNESFVFLFDFKKSAIIENNRVIDSTNLPALDGGNLIYFFKYNTKTKILSGIHFELVLDYQICSAGLLSGTPMILTLTRNQGTFTLNSYNLNSDAPVLSKSTSVFQADVNCLN